MDGATELNDVHDLGGDGAFPFGRPNTVRPVRPAQGMSKATMVGVYPSALHVTWRAPLSSAGEGRTGRVSALAVDVEPEVFWDGADAGGLIEGWKSAVGFVTGDDPGQHGHVTGSPSTNGSSGKKVRDLYLIPVHLHPSEVTFTDVYPVYMTKRGSRPSAHDPSPAARRGQRDAIEQEYDAIAAAMDHSPASLPERIPDRSLPAEAARQFGGRLIADLLAAGSPLVITLGEEPWRTLALLDEVELQPPAARLTDLYGPANGSRGRIRIGTWDAEWLPLAHPGLISPKPKQGTSAPSADAKRTTAGWTATHHHWANDPAH